MVGKAPTSKPISPFNKELPLKTSTTNPPIEDKSEKIIYQTRLKTSSHDASKSSIKNPVIKSGMLKISKTLILEPQDEPYEYPEGYFIKQVETIPREKNPNNIKINDIVWAIGPGAPRWPGRATTFFEDGSIRVFWCARSIFKN